MEVRVQHGNVLTCLVVLADIRWAMRHHLFWKFVMELLQRYLLLLIWGFLTIWRMGNIIWAWCFINYLLLTLAYQGNLLNSKLTLSIAEEFFLFFVIPNIKTIFILGVGGACVFIGTDSETFLCSCLLCFHHGRMLTDELVEIEQVTISIVITILAQEILPAWVRTMFEKNYDYLFDFVWWQLIS